MKPLRTVGAYLGAVLVLLPVITALIVANVGLVVLHGVAWPLEQLRGRCMLYLHAVQALTGSSS